MITETTTLKPTKLEVLAGMASDSYRRAGKRLQRFSDAVGPHINDFCLGLVWEQIVTSFGKSGWNKDDYLCNQSRTKLDTMSMVGFVAGMALDVAPFLYAGNQNYQNSQANETALIYYGAKIATQTFAWGARHFKKAYDAKEEELTKQRVNTFYKPFENQPMDLQTGERK